MSCIFLISRTLTKKLRSQDGKRGKEMKILTGRRFNVEREYYTFLQKANRRFKIVLSTHVCKKFLDKRTIQ